MSKTQFQDLRGWDKSDPFGLTIIGAMDTLEREGHLTHNMKNRKRVGLLRKNMTIIERNLGLNRMNIRINLLV